MLRKITDRIFYILGSTKTTAVLFILLTFFFLLGQWIPQKRLLGALYIEWLEKRPGLVAFLDYIGFTDIYSSPLMFFLFSVFFLNLIFVMTRRLKVVRERIKLPSLETCDISGYPFKEEVYMNDLSSVSMKSFLKGYAIYGDEKNFIAIKNRFSPLATLLFHLSFFLLLAGGVLTTLTRFSASLDLAEGEEFTGDIAQYGMPIRFPQIGHVPHVRFSVERIEPVAVNDIPVDIRVYIRDDKGMQRIISINHPFKRDYTSFVIRHMGVAPLMVLYDKDGKEIGGAYVRLDVFKGKVGSFMLGKRFFEVLFYPDFYEKDNEIGTRSDIIRNPVFAIKLKDREPAKVLMRPGERNRLGEYELAIPEMRYWVRFIVVRERGLGIVYGGFFIITLALCIRLLFYRREIRGFVKEEDGRKVLILGGRSEFYKVLFEDEFRALLERLSLFAQKPP